MFDIFDIKYEGYIKASFKYVLETGKGEKCLEQFGKHKNKKKDREKRKEKFGCFCWRYFAQRCRTFTSGTSEQFWEVETDLKWESLTRAAKEGEEVGVLEADVEGKLALGGVH